MKKKLHQNNVRWLITLIFLFLIGLFVGLEVSQFREVRPFSSQTSKNPKTVLANVLYVIDGDTIDVVIDGKKERVRLIGIDAPEVEYEDKPADCFADESAASLKALIDGKAVSLASDPTQGDRDSYGRLLRYAYLSDNTNVNKQMVSQGYARQYSYKGIPYQFQKEFQEAEREAKKLKKGLWADGVCQ